MKKLCIVPILLWLSVTIAQSQNFNFSFRRNQNIAVLDIANQSLPMPWTGGINSIFVSEIDIDRDGHLDLFLFEKHGNRIVPLIWETDGSYRYAPEYRYQFPELHNWAFLKDYDGDGKEDLFTYGLAGIRVFKNISNTTLQFQLITEQLNSYYYNGYTNIFTSPDDYFALEDVDNDGDLDILNFWLLGKYLHFQKNLSIENYQTTDSLTFVLADECWGNFSEAADNSEITLFTDCSNKETSQNRHIGSSIFAFDFTRDGLLDLVIGDVDSPELIFLQNGGSIDEPLMISQTTLFPNPTYPVHLYSMPALSHIDLDNDGEKEMIVSPSDPALTKSQDHNSVWLYNYDSNTESYILETRALWQEETIDVGSGALPILYDWNSDGLLDLFICNYGRYDSTQIINGIPTSSFSSSISYYQNVGDSQNPEFKLISNDFGGFRSSNQQALFVTFGDLNSDGLTDLICGNRDGTLSLFYTQSVQGALPQLSAPEQPFSLADVGHFSTPQLFDIDNDGVLELFVGNRRGNIAYYRNDGTAQNPNFVLRSEEFGGVDVRNENISFFGYSVPNFVRINGETHLFCGNEQGTIFSYKNIDGNIDGIFTQDHNLVEEVAGRPQYISDGIRSGIAAGMLNGDDKIDVIVGNWAGGICYYEGCAPLPTKTPEIAEMEHFYLFPNPAKDQITINSTYHGGALLSLYDAIGNCVINSISKSFPTTISLFDLPSGIYFLKISPTEQNISLRSKNNAPIIKKVIIFANH